MNHLLASPSCTPSPSTDKLSADMSAAAAAEPVYVAIAHLARSLFSSSARNRIVMPRWMAEPPPPPPLTYAQRAELTRSSQSWEDVQRARQIERRAVRQRALAARSGGAAAAAERQQQRLLSTLVPAATAGVNRRQPRTTARVLSMVDAMNASQQRWRRRMLDDTSTTTTTSLVEQVAAVIELLLTVPAQLTIVADSTASATSIDVYPFGRDRYSMIVVSGTELDMDEAAAIELLGMAADRWIDDTEYLRSSSGLTRNEVLTASRDSNDCFELALDRMALVTAFIDVLLYGSGTHVRARHVVEAAVAAAAALPSIISRDFSVPLIRLAEATRLTALPRAPITREALVASVAYSRETAHRLRVHTVDSDDYMRSVYAQWHLNVDECIASVLATTAGAGK